MNTATENTIPATGVETGEQATAHDAAAESPKNTKRKYRAKKSQNTIVKVRLADLQPNPYWGSVQPGGSHFEEAVAGLKGSLEKNGFWSRFTARKVGDHYEIAFHHHLLRALRELYGDDYEVDVDVRDLSDEDMLKLLSAENADYVNNNGHRADRDLNLILQTKALIERQHAEKVEKAKDSKGRAKHQDSSQGVGAGQIAKFLGPGFSASKVKKMLAQLNPKPAKSTETTADEAQAPTLPVEEIFPGSDQVQKFAKVSNRMIKQIDTLKVRFEDGTIQMANDQGILRLIGTLTDELNRLQAAITNRKGKEAV